MSSTYISGKRLMRFHTDVCWANWQLTVLLVTCLRGSALFLLDADNKYQSGAVFPSGRQSLVECHRARFLARYCSSCILMMSLRWCPRQSRFSLTIPKYIAVSRTLPNVKTSRVTLTLLLTGPISGNCHLMKLSVSVCISVLETKSTSTR